MAKSEVIKKLISAHINGDEVRFREAVEALIKDEKQSSHNLLAEDLRTLLQRDIKHQGNILPTHLTFMQGNNRQASQPSVPLVDILSPNTSLSNLILSNETEKRLARIIEEHRRFKELAAYSLRPVKRLLFIGPPGCGKTYSAGMLAHELALPLVYVRVDAVLSSYLGETSSNLRKVFEYSLENPCVLFFDEFDSVGTDRGNPQEIGELRRVVNSFLQLIDSWNGQGIIIAATNYDELLDHALWRRFEDVITFNLPLPNQIVSYLRMLVRGISKKDDLELSKFATQMEGLSFSQIQEIIYEAIKTMVLRGEKCFGETYIAEQLEMTSSLRKKQKLINKHFELKRETGKRG